MKNSKSESNKAKFEIRPASDQEVGLFYAMPPGQDAELGCIGHVRIDFGSGGDRFYHAWHTRGPEELNTQGFKDELTAVVDEMRKSVLKDFATMTSYCRSHGGEISGGWVQNYGYIAETDRYRYCLRCNPAQGDYQAYLTCFDKQVQEMNQAKHHKQKEQTHGTVELQIKGYYDQPITLKPRVELYSVTDYKGQEMPGLALAFDMVGEEPGELEPYTVLTKSFGEFIGIKNSAYIDTNNCSFAGQLLELGLARPTVFQKASGYCTYPLWIFNEEFLQEIGGEKYQKYAQAFDQYMNPFENEDLATDEQSESFQPVMGGM